MSLPLLHAGKSAPGLSAALDLRFALDKSLTAYRGPTPSFSRASTGSYFDGSGVLRYANVNLLTYSENFSDASWTKNSATVTNDSIVSPDGKTTADTLTESSANATHFVNKASSTSAGTIYTSSIYAKAGTRKYIDVTSVAQDGGIFRRFNNVFDLETGTWQSTASLNSPANTAYSITSVGNGWYRISSSILAYGSTHYLVVYLSNSANPTRDAANDVVYTGNGTGNLYIWGAQLETGSTVGTYCPTTSSANSAPRFNHTYNGTSWVSRGLLVEEQRTNILQYSESFSTSPWSSLGAPTITTNTDIAPDGSQTSDTINDTSNSSFWGVAQSFSTSSGSTYTFSIYIKKTSVSPTNYPLIQMQVGASSYSGIIINTLTGAISVVSGGSYVAPTSYYSSDNSNYWRISITAVINSSTSQVQFYPAGSSDGSTISSAATGAAVVWGAMTELGAFPTSYIPTTSASTTRSADVCQITGGNFSSIWNGTEGSFAVEYDLPSANLGDRGLLMANDGTVAKYIAIYGQTGSGQPGKNTFIVVDSSLQANIYAATVAANTTTKIAAAWKLNDFANYSQGTNGTPDGAGTIPSPLTQLEIGKGYPAGIGDPIQIGHIARLRYFNKRLPNATLQQLST